MRIGYINVQYNERSYIEQCLTPWIEAKKNLDLKLCLLDGCFLENDGNPPNSTDGSDIVLESYYKSREIDHFERLPAGLKEHEARNVGLKWLLDQGCDVIISSAMDEYFSAAQIDQIFKFVEREPFVAFFKLQYKNYVFDNKSYVLGFNPHRIWRIKYNDYKLKEFSFDDDILYQSNAYTVPDKLLPHKTIPGILINHLSWNDLERSKKKIKYAERHFGNVTGDPKSSCSFRYNEQENKIEFNPDYYKKIGQPFPEVFED